MLRACPAAVAADVSGCIQAAIGATLATMTCTARTMRWIRGLGMPSILLALAPCSAMLAGNLRRATHGARPPRTSGWPPLCCSVMRRPDFDPASRDPARR